MNNRTLFSDYLDILGIPHTELYSSERFTAYPPKLAIIGIEDLLREYNADVKRVKAGSDKDLSAFSGPFVAQLSDGHYVIVTDVSKDNVTYLCAVLMVIYGYVNNRLYSTLPTLILPFLYGFGIYICYLLVLKQSHVQSDAADSVCGIIQKNGCGTVLDTDASKLFGLFPWCEIGLSYFTVSEIAILLYPQCVNYLAIISVCCLPYTFWSVLYQRFKIHAWCTLCLTIQALMWIIFLVFLFGGEFKNLLPIKMDAFILLMAYGCALFIFNWIIPIIFKYELSKDEVSTQE